MEQILLLAVLIITVNGQSDNPAGNTYFDSSFVREITINTNQTGTLQSQSSYQDYWYLYIPKNVGSIALYFKNTGYGTVCSSAANLYYVHEYSGQSPHFPCEKDDPSYCTSFDGGSDDSGAGVTFYHTPVTNDAFPGSYLYFSILSQQACSYMIGVTADRVCDGASAVLYGDTTSNCTSYQNVTNGETINGTLATAADYFAYSTFVPQNTSRIWATLVSQSGDLALGYGLQYANIDNGNISPVFNATENTYTYTYTNTKAYGNVDVIFTVYASSSLSAPADFAITIGYEYCGASLAGIGDSSNLVAYPDCTYPVQQIPLASGPHTFQLAAFNASTDSGYSSIFTYLSPSFGTTGYFNVTCNSTDTTHTTFAVFGSGYMPSCSTGFVSTLDCSGTGIIYYYLNMLWLSQNLYPGQYWSVAICTQSTSDVSVTINLNGALQPSPSPSPSVTPSSSPSSTPSPSASTSVSPGSSTPSATPATSVIPAVSSSPSPSADASSSGCGFKLVTSALVVMLALLVTFV